jgi:hypothetical protein
MTADPTDPAWRLGIEALQDEAQGVMSLVVIHPAEAPALFLDAAAGVPGAIQALNAYSDTMWRIRSAPRRDPMLCAACPRPLRKRAFAIVLAIPERDDPTRCLGLGICGKCASTDAQIRAKALEGLRRLWPTAREIEISGHPAGHA